jgi:hypothetical protein
MEKGTHGKAEKSFEELSFADQAKSLNAQIIVLEKAINAHLRKGGEQSKDIVASRSKYLLQLKKVIDNLENS